MEAGGIVLAGGRSTRMGSAKATLDWHGAPLVAHLAAVVRRGVGGGPVVVVRAPGQELPALPAWAETVTDREEGRGPLEGLRGGLERLAARGIEAAFVASVDVPLLHPVFAQTVVARLARDGGGDAVVPEARGHRQPLVAAYRTSLASLVAELLDHGLARPAFLLERCDAIVVAESELLADPRLAQADPGLRSVVNVNTPAELEEARSVARPEIEVTTYGVARLRAGVARATVAAVRLGDAAAAVGVELDGHVVAAVDGVQIVTDTLYPLVDGDRVAFFGADAGG